MEECLLYIKNICNEVGKINDKFLPNVDRITLRNRLLSFFDNKKDCNIKLLDSILVNLSKSELNRIYYKNNIYEFSKHKKILNILHDIAYYTESFKDPNSVPDETMPYLLIIIKKIF